MKKLIHLSDMHFGRFDEQCLEPLIAACNKIKPDYIIISGDFTQRARKKEFEEAQYFLSKLKHPFFVIPGNHDILPVYRLHTRLRTPFMRYETFISRELEPTFHDDEISIVSINTVRAAKLSSGGINISQIEKTQKAFKKTPNHFKIIVTHHPIDLPIDYHKKKLAGKAKAAIRALSKIGVDMYLSGHFHVSAAVNSATRNSVENYAPIMVQAGTVSVRQRGELQSFNVIDIDSKKIEVSTHVWDQKTKTFTWKITKDFPRVKHI